MKRTIIRGQVRNREVGCEGRLWETCELMNKNRIKVRRGLGSWHHTANPFGSSMEVNTAVVQGSIERLPREASMVGIRWFQSTTKTNALVPAMVRGVSIEESAESIVVVAPRTVSSCRRIIRPTKSAANQIR
jgi:hypothetical protein